MNCDISLGQEKALRELLASVREYRNRAAARPHEVMRLNLAIQRVEAQFPVSELMEVGQ